MKHRIILFLFAVLTVIAACTPDCILPEEPETEDTEQNDSTEVETGKEEEKPDQEDPDKEEEEDKKEDTDEGTGDGTDDGTGDGTDEGLITPFTTASLGHEGISYIWEARISPRGFFSWGSL